jgi:GntR family transcriptional regulator/MocR family aminotransferase
LGGTLSLNKRIAILEWAQQADAWILEDDYDSELRYNGKPLAALQGLDAYGRVIYMGTFSKVIYPGLRIGYVVFPTKQMAEHFTKVKAVFDRQTPIMEQAIVAEFISEGHFFRHLRRMRVVYAERQQFLLKAISKEAEKWFSVQPEEAGLHLTAWLKKGLDDKKVSATLAKEGIIANALSEYAIAFKAKPGLLLGYSAYNKFKLRHHMARVGRIMDKYFA